MDIGSGRFVIMGVSGVGKTRVAAALAAALAGRFVEGDDLHAPESRAKMAAGIPLTDDDRWPWLDRVGDALAEGDAPVVAACSALRRRYRDRLRTRAPDLVTVFLEAAHDVVAERLGARQGHFMPPSLLRSQFEALEPLDPGERGVTVDADAPVAMVAERARRALAAL